MTDEDILGAIQEHLGGRGIDPETVQPGAELTNDLDLDSLDTVELTLGLEKRFQIQIPDEELEDLVTVRDAVDLIAKKLSVGGPRG
jgi:acyl carrier protein